MSWLSWKHNGYGEWQAQTPEFVFTIVEEFWMSGGRRGYFMCVHEMYDGNLIPRARCRYKTLSGAKVSCLAWHCRRERFGEKKGEGW